LTIICAGLGFLYLYSQTLVMFNNDKGVDFSASD
jgi:hypothetical protein